MPGFLSGPHPRPFAHRGGDEVAPENTMAAFRAAAQLGYSYLETDVHLTADGYVVAFHDDTLDRVTDTVGVIGELDWADVSSARVAGEYRIPLLVELFEEFPHAFFNIDPKEDAVVGPLANVIQREQALNRVCVGSFSDARLSELGERLGPGLCRALGPRQIAKLAAAAMGAPASAFDGQCAQVPVTVRGKRLVTQRLVTTAHQRGMEVHVWTINEVAEMHYLLDLGVDGIMTDRPSLLKDVLTVRGQWTDT